MVEERLIRILGHVNEWLKFAENKNAALIAFNSAVAFGIVALLNDLDGLPLGARVYLWFCIGLLVLGTIASLFSFLPQLHLPWIFPRLRTDAKDNLLYFGHIARYTPDSYLEALARIDNEETKEHALIVRLYAEQVVRNSQIAVCKYRWFSAALWCTLTAFATPIVPGIGLVIWHVRRKRRR